MFHDALVEDEVLDLAPRAEQIAVGKRCGAHATSQRFINKRLVDAAARHAVVVRLKGGDPMLFGRAQEEIDALAAAGVDVEVVPGVTAALAAAADLSVSLTRRGVARSVALVTPRVGEGETPHAWASGGRQRRHGGRFTWARARRTPSWLRLPRTVPTAQRRWCSSRTRVDRLWRMRPVGSPTCPRSPPDAEAGRRSSSSARLRGISFARRGFRLAVAPAADPRLPDGRARHARAVPFFPHLAGSPGRAGGLRCNLPERITIDLNKRG